MKYFFLSLLITLFCGFGVIKAQNIEVSPSLVATNYWVPGDYLSGLMAVNGAVDTANFQLIRIGGFGANSYSDAQFSQYITQIKAIGAEPIVQISATKSIAAVKSLITRINITEGKKVKYWSIGNEPDHSGGGDLSIETIAAYTKKIATALKEVDPTIKTIGFDLAGYNEGYWSKVIGGSLDVTGKDANGNYYIDIISWHRYNIASVADIQSKVTDMLPRLANVNKKRPDSPIRWMMGEINMHYDNEMVTNPDGYCWSFWAGQLFAGIWKMGIQNNAFSFCEWSIAEGGSNRSGGDLGLFDGEYKGRSLYYHSMMFNQNIKKYYAVSTDNQDNVETISMKDSTGVAVMITNSNKNKAFAYSLRLDNTLGTASSLQIKIDAAIDKEISGTIPAFATQMLVFNENGVFEKLYTYTFDDSELRKGPSIIFPESECNAMPTVNPVKSEIRKAGSGAFTVTFTGITDGEGSSENLTVTAHSMDSTVAAIESFTYNSSADSAIVVINPLKRGNTSVILKITDKGAAGCSKPAVNSTGVGVKVFEVIDIPALIEVESNYEMVGLTPEVSALGTVDYGYSDIGDYLEYKINVPSTGTYYLTAGVASGSTTGGATLAVKEGSTILGTFSVPSTGGWQTWTQKIVTLNLTQGEHLLRVEFTKAGANIDYLIFSSINPATNYLPYVAITSHADAATIEETSSITLTASCYDKENKVKKVDFYANNLLIASDLTAPYSVEWKTIFVGTQKIKAVVTDDAGNSISSEIKNINITKAAVPQSIPGKIEAENYSNMLGVQIQATVDAGGGDNVGYIDANDWLDYSLKVEESGVYKISARLAGWAAGKYLELRDANGKVLTKINVPNSGTGTAGDTKYQTWANAQGETTFTLLAGVQLLRLFSVNGSVNINYFTFEKTGDAGPTSLNINPSSISLAKGDHIELIATGTDDSGAFYSVNPDWTCDNNGLINQFGVFLASETGTYVVTAKSGSLEKSLIITVSETISKYKATLTVQSNGKLVANATVNLNGAEAKTNASGIVVFEGLSPANDLFYTVKATNYFDTLGVVDVVAADVNQSIEIRGFPTYSVSFTIKEDGVAVENATVTFNGSSKTSDASGVVVFDDFLPAAGLSYKVTKANYNDVSGKITIVDADVNQAVSISKKTVGVDLVLISAIKVYPNPASDYLMIENATNSTVQIVDMVGRLMLSKSILSENQPVNISSLPAGVYSVVVQLNTSTFSQLIRKEK